MDLVPDCMMRVVLITILLGGAVVVAAGQQPASNMITPSDKTSIIESVLNLEKDNIADFTNLRDVSSENIEDIDPWRVSTAGFTIVPAISLYVRKLDHVIEYLLFKKISLSDGVAVVQLARVTEGRGCFASFYSEQRYTYKARRSPFGWIAELSGRPAPPNSLTRSRTKRWP